MPTSVTPIRRLGQDLHDGARQSLGARVENAILGIELVDIDLQEAGGRGHRPGLQGAGTRTFRCRAWDLGVAHTGNPALYMLVDADRDWLVAWIEKDADGVEAGLASRRRHDNPAGWR